MVLPSEAGMSSPHIDKMWRDLETLANREGTSVKEIVDYMSSISDPEVNSYYEYVDLTKPNDTLAMFYVLEALPQARLEI